MAEPSETIADAIVTFLPTQTYADMAVTEDSIQWAWHLQSDIKDMQQLKVVVIPQSVQHQGGGRHHSEDIHALVVHILLPGLEDEHEKISAFRAACDEIVSHLMYQAQGGYAWFPPLEQDPMLSIEELGGHTLYHCQLMVRYYNAVNRRS